MNGVHPYIAFKGNCREAIDFYKKALRAEEVYVHTYGDSPMPDMGAPDQIMHCTIKVGDTHIMMCDDPRSDAVLSPGCISLAVGIDDANRARTVFVALAEDGTITMPIEKTFWAEAFGMLTDKFGINWMVNCEARREDDKSVSA